MKLNHAAPLVALLLAACGGPGPEVRVPDGTPIVLISIDTLRSDRLPMYGYDRVETPALDALRRDGILYERTYSPVPMTLPAHATMLSGVQPDAHRVRDNMGYHLDAAEIPWLPRALRERGYTTGAAVSAFVVRGDTGLGHAFDFFEDRIGQSRWTQLASVQRRGGETLAATREWLRSVHREPFFLFFHLYEPHRPLEPPEPFASRYASAYDGEVASADAVVGKLLDELRSLDVYDAALVVFTSDHGEGLGDHGFQEHGPLLYREQIQVPLVVKLPGDARAGETVAAPAQLADLAPTVLAALGLDVPEELPGTSLLGLSASGDGEGRPIFSETLFPRLHFGWSELASVVRWPYHYIHGPDPELYDLAADPGETRNVLRENRRVYAELRDALEEGYDTSYQPPGETVDSETRSKLAALGYLGSAAAEREGPLPDPKTRLHVFEDLGEAMEHFQQNDFEPAVERFRAVLEEEPGLVDGWLYLGHALLGLGRDRDALEAYERLVELTGGAPYATLAAATPLLRLGRVDEAVGHARAALVQHPMEAYDLLARAALEQGDLEAAEEHAAEAVKHRGARFGPLITQAEVALARGDPERALELAEQARTEAEAAPEDMDRGLLRGLHFARGEAHARLGNAGRAERAFIEEIRRFPEELRAYTHLALLYALSGENQEAGDALRRMLQANQTPAAFAEAARTLRVLGDPQSADRLLEEARRRWPEAAELREEAG
ncbi:MAG: sulfatase-like hydrolase/transferase [Thermoanaerobaculia bacterium]